MLHQKSVLELESRGRVGARTAAGPEPEAGTGAGTRAGTGAAAAEPESGTRAGTSPRTGAAAEVT